MKESLSIWIYSFGFHKSGIPSDRHGHGGGFVFDCRMIQNPGRIKAYRDLTGLDEPVVAFLEKLPQVPEFLHHVNRLIDMMIEHHENRNFRHLMVSFGCTGGQHRSVFFAEAVAARLRNKGFSVHLEHCDLPSRTVEP